MEKIYVKLTDIPEVNTRKQFLKQFLEKKPDTFFDENCKKLQCEHGRFRSITELHQIVSTRFPKTTFPLILRVIKLLINEDKGLTMVWCTQVEKVVLKYLDHSTHEYISKYSKRHYLNTKGKDGYSLNNYQELLKNL